MAKKVLSDTKNSILPKLRSTYVMIMILSFVVGILLFYFFEGSFLYVGYVVLLFLFLVTLGLYRNFYYTKIYRRLRPFVVVRILQIVSSAAWVGLMFVSISGFSRDELLIYALLWLASFSLVFQFYRIFNIAQAAKKKRPNVCEFC